MIKEFIQISLILIAFLLAVMLCSLCYPQEIDTGIIIEIESGGNSQAFNKASGAIGLMQITPIVVDEYNQVTASYPGVNLDDLYDSFWNRYIGEWFIERIKTHYLKGKGTVDDVLVCYSWGYGRWRKWNAAGRVWGQLPRETRNYIFKYRRLLNEKANN